MVIKNLKIVLPKRVVEKGYLCFESGRISYIGEGEYLGAAIDGNGLLAMPGFIDIHVHGSKGIDFMDAGKDDYKTVADSLYSEGVTTFLATTLTSDFDSLNRVCMTVAEAKAEVPSLAGIHLEGPYISEARKGAQNAAYIRNPDIEEFEKLQKSAKGNIRCITLAPEKPGAKSFIRYVSDCGVTVSAGHSDATFSDMKEALEHGLTNVTHTHNAMSGHHHRNPGIVTAAFYYDGLYTEFIGDGIHVCPQALMTSYKIIGPERFILITDALSAKHSDKSAFQLFGLDCVKKDGAAYLTSGPLAGSLLSMDQAVRNMREYTGASLVELSKISSSNAAKSLHLLDRGSIEVGKLADIVLLDGGLNVKVVYKEGKEVYFKQE